MEKIKQFLQSEKGKDLLTVLIVVLVGFGSFVLGRLSKENSPQNTQAQYSDQNGNNQDANVVSAPDVGLEQAGNTTSQNTSGSSSNKPFFASSKGKKYYTANCGAGKTIKPANLIYFDTEATAQKAGYTLSSSC
jgi:hypothetical protein